MEQNVCYWLDQIWASDLDSVSFESQGTQTELKQAQVLSVKTQPQKRKLGAEDKNENGQPNKKARNERTTRFPLQIMSGMVEITLNVNYSLDQIWVSLFRFGKL